MIKAPEESKTEAAQPFEEKKVDGVEQAGSPIKSEEDVKDQIDEKEERKSAGEPAPVAGGWDTLQCFLERI